MKMRFILHTCLLLVLSAVCFGQPPQQVANPADKPAVKHLRIADTLTPQEKLSRNTVILRSELDSLLKEANANQPVQLVKEPEPELVNAASQYILPGLIVIIALLVLVIYLLFRNQHTIHQKIASLQEKTKQPEAALSSQSQPKEKKGKALPQTVEAKISDLNAELNKLLKENEGLNRVIKEYNGVQHEYDSLKHGILKAYKVKNYPGYDKNKNDNMAMQGVLETENAVAVFAYEKFLKPILAIADANKNSPAKINAADREKILDLLLSLSLLYIEYLYLRVNELSIGGNMVERIQGLSKGKALDISSLKKLSTEFGSRALVIKLALDKISLNRLSYPVFDETNLNNQ